MRNEGMAARLSHHASARINENDGKVAGARARHEIARVLLVSGRVGDDELSFRGCEIAVSDIDGDALFALRAQAVGEQREIDPFAAAPFVFALRALDLVFKRALRLDE